MDKTHRNVAKVVFLRMFTGGIGGTGTSRKQLVKWSFMCSGFIKSDLLRCVYLLCVLIMHSGRVGIAAFGSALSYL